VDERKVRKRSLEESKPISSDCNEDWVWQRGFRALKKGYKIVDG